VTAPPTVDEFAHRGGEEFERWFNKARVVLMFVLGCALIVYSVIDNATNLAYIIIGAVLIGLVPVDQWLTMRARNGGNGNGTDPNG
jgi:hypothetical protein